jgi:hypothetical protein
MRLGGFEPPTRGLEGQPSVRHGLPPVGETACCGRISAYAGRDFATYCHGYLARISHGEHLLSALTGYESSAITERRYIYRVDKQRPGSAAREGALSLGPQHGDQRRECAAQSPQAGS